MDKFKLKRGLPRAQSRGFTLTEVIVTIAIFSSMLIIGSSVLATNYVAGKPASIQKQKINRDMSFVSGAIHQQMQNANVSDSTSGIDGFRITQVLSEVTPPLTATPNKNLISAIIDQPNGFAYFGTNDAPGKIIKINLSTFQVVDTLAVSSGNYLYTAVIDQPKQLAYFGSYDFPGRIIKIDLSTFKEVGNILLASGENSLRSAIIDQPNGFAYFGTATTPGKIAKVNLSTFTEVGTALTLASGENNLVSAIIDQPRQLAYFGTDTVPTAPPDKIIKINIDPSTFTKVSTLPLASGENSLWSAVIDQPKQLAYFGTTNTTPGKIIKINLADFTKVSTLPLASGENNLDSAVINQSTGFAYFGAGAYSTQGKIAKIDLATFTEVGTALPLTTTGLLWSAVIDQSTGFIYFGTYDFGGVPGKISKINSTGSMLAIATAHAAADGVQNECAFIGLDSGTQAVWMLQETCSSTPHLTVDTNTFQKISSSDIKITGFNFSDISTYSRTTPVIPKFTLTVQAKDQAGIIKNPMNIRNTYYVSYDTIRGF